MEIPFMVLFWGTVFWLQHQTENSHLISGDYLIMTFVTFQTDWKKIMGLVGGDKKGL